VSVYFVACWPFTAARQSVRRQRGHNYEETVTIQKLIDKQFITPKTKKNTPYRTGKKNPKITIAALQYVLHSITVFEIPTVLYYKQ